ncbi:unnamed protein product [Symbiodinium natans]|uniref:J domain-containing protein n=1 Tax=Symbiodinium natans TaxID=878477 RepID=A0A812KVD7_9DINO|nr:unnamed protein product [Symbiodinium natans]
MAFYPGRSRCSIRVKSDAPLRPRGADGRRRSLTLGSHVTGFVIGARDCILLSEWIAEAADVFETMLLPLEVEGFKGANTRYKQLLLLVHPDKNRQEGATDAFRKLFDAFAVIVDPAAPPGSGARFCARRAARAAKPEKVRQNMGQSKRGSNGQFHPHVRSFNLDPATGIGGVVAAVFMQDNVDESERVLHEQSELLEALGKQLVTTGHNWLEADILYDGSDKTWVSPETAKALWDTAFCQQEDAEVVGILLGVWVLRL